MTKSPYSCCNVARTGRRTAAFLGVLLALATALVMAVACSSQPGAPDPAIGGTASPAAVSRTGQEIFATTCAVCHGAAGQGQPNWRVAKEDGTLPPPPLNGDGHTWHHADGLLYRIVSQGGAISNLPSFKSGMPAFGERLSHQEIVGVLTYIKSLWGDKTYQDVSIRESQALLSEEDPFPPGGS